MSGDRLREALLRLADEMDTEDVMAGRGLGEFADEVRALAADERGGGEGLDVERLAKAVHGSRSALFEASGPADCDRIAVAIAAEYGRLAAAQPASHVAEGERRELPTAEWARLRAIDDIVRELVDGWDNGFPMEDDRSATDVIERLRPFLTEPAEPRP